MLILLFGAPIVTGLTLPEQKARLDRVWTKTADQLWEIEGVPGRSMTYVVDWAVAPGEPIAYGLALGATGVPLSWTTMTYLGRDGTGITLEKLSGTVTPSEQCAKMYADGLKGEQDRTLLVTITVLACRAFGGSSEKQSLRLPLPPTSFATTLPAVPVFIPRFVIGLKAEGDSGLRVEIDQTRIGR